MSRHVADLGEIPLPYLDRGRTTVTLIMVQEALKSYLEPLSEAFAFLRVLVL